LKSGASPHGYQRVSLINIIEPRFIFPISNFIEEDKFTLKDRQILVKELLASGLIIPRYVE
jgi:hypothetical protein